VKHNRPPSGYRLVVNRGLEVGHEQAHSCFSQKRPMRQVVARACCVLPFVAPGDEGEQQPCSRR
jgi:hypothetical protein